ncbi:LOW QUALITY PROTEIN: putative inorganic phosphate cotransporter, partial [Drosophila nasuta]|uniref:LOW QUALITY PROTEIN: putative inorganic phosphate cotransporter n=1 Tax=Drosophila nasuta TaxID=42062 RepID=UPI00295F245C
LTGPAFGQRHVQSLLIFFAIVVNYMGKFNASVAVVAMTNSDTSNHDIPTYDWNEMERSFILSSFFWGYILTQFLGGWLCRRFGARITMFASTFGSAVMVILVPFFVPWGGWQSFCAIRGCMGAFQGMLFPSIHTHLANWCPPKERNRLGALSNTGIDFGSVVTMFVSGLIAASSIGWPGIFYVACGVEVLWCIFWLIFGANTPRQSKFISPEELEYIETSKNENKKLEEAKETRQIPVPWKAILTSVPLWTLFLVRCTQAWGNSTLQAEIPAYMKGVLQMDMKSNALYSALPYLCSWILAFVYVIMADILLTRGIMTITGIRKLINSLSSWLPAIFLIGLAFLDSDQKTLAIVLMCLSVGINAGSTIGCTLNTIDLSPNHAGILMGIVNTGGNGIPILTPLVVGVIVKNENDRAEWQVVFIISAVIFFVGNLVYVIFGQMVSQPWDAADFLDKQKASHIEENGEANLKAIHAKENAKQAEEKNMSDQQDIKT